MNISLPTGVSYHKEQLTLCQAFIFRHQELGELGRIVLQDLPNGHCNISSEVVGDPVDPMTKKREEIFIPLSKQITATMETIFGKNASEKAASPGTIQSEQEIIESKLIPCEKCGVNVAMLIFAYDAAESDQFEDYARKMYLEYTSLDISTWIIGLPTIILGDHTTPSPIMKVWPNRESIKISTADTFNSELNVFIDNHCK